jgi:hypothetical protein
VTNFPDRRLRHEADILRTRPIVTSGQRIVLRMYLTDAANRIERLQRRAQSIESATKDTS